MFRESPLELLRRLLAPCCACLALAVATAYPHALVAQDSGPDAARPLDRLTAPPPSSTAVHIETVEGLVTGPLESLAIAPEAGTASLGGETVQLDAVVVIRFPEGARPAARFVYVFDLGEEVRASPGAGTEDELVLRSALLRSPGGEALRARIDSLRALAQPAQFPSPEHFMRFRAGLGGSRIGPIPLPNAPEVPKAVATSGGAEPEDGALESDVILTREGSTITGLLNRIDESGVQFEAESLGVVHLAYEKIRAVTIAELDEGGEESSARPGALGVVATFQDRSVLVGTLGALGGGKVTLHSNALGAVEAPLGSLLYLELRGGRSDFLSDLDPVSVSHTADLFDPRPVQRDANVLGGPLSIRRQIYRKGLGMLSHARLDYALDGRYSRFRAFIGMDDTARPRTLEAERRQGGHALFRVWVDDRVVFEKELSHRDDPYPLDVSLDGAKRLGIETDYGPGFLILDYANWADARLIKSPLR